MTRRTLTSRRFVASALLTLGGAATLTAQGFRLPQKHVHFTIRIETVSSRPELISGGDVLVRIHAPSWLPPGDVAVRLNGADVTASFWSDPDGDGLTGVVSGLAVGRNRLEARSRWLWTDVLEITNYPITGPVISGPQEKPFFCQTHQYGLPGGFLTASPIADPCFVPSVVYYMYRTLTPSPSNELFKPLANPLGPHPPDLATTSTGQPYVVRVEVGTINRAIYQLTILDNPAVAGPSPRDLSDPGWNGKLVYIFGGGCTGGWHAQGTSTSSLSDFFLGSGFAVASASLNTLGENCNDVVSAETMMMVKERFIEANGVPMYTMGWGCSGGAIQQYMIADNYPGLLDGIVPQCSFPEQFGSASTDARLLRRYFGGPPSVSWTDAQKLAVSGFGTLGHVENQGTIWAARIDPVAGRPGFPPNSSSVFDAIVPASARYDPVVNPTGARATVFDHNVNTFGRDSNGFARRPLDNVGVQYGLAALNAGQISVEQFLDLNEKMGGFDKDANFIPERTTADPAAVRAAYETGKILNGGGGLASTPILDVDGTYTDLAVNGDIHLKYNHFAARERLIHANGNADNMVIWSGAFGARSSPALIQALIAMDEWLTAIVADTSHDSDREKAIKNKPASLTDGCWTGTTAATARFNPEPQFFGGIGSSPCNTSYPAFGFPRLVAGSPLSNDVIACSLEGIAMTDYAVSFTAADEARLRSLFNRGVCDYSRPGVPQRVGLKGTWMSYPSEGRYMPAHPRRWWH
jgi:hypothetical protein